MLIRVPMRKTTKSPSMRAVARLSGVAAMVDLRRFGYPRDMRSPRAAARERPIRLTLPLWGKLEPLPSRRRSRHHGRKKRWDHALNDQVPNKRSLRSTSNWHALDKGVGGIGGKVPLSFEQVILKRKDNCESIVFCKMSLDRTDIQPRKLARLGVCYARNASNSLDLAFEWRIEPLQPIYRKPILIARSR